MTIDDARRNAEIRMTMGTFRVSCHLSIRASFVIRHSCFVIPVTSIHSRAARRLFSSLPSSRLTSPSPQWEEELPWSCATPARAPTRRDDRANPHGEWRTARHELPDKAVSLGAHDRDATPYCQCTLILRKL